MMKFGFLCIFSCFLHANAQFLSQSWFYVGNSTYSKRVPPPSTDFDEARIAPQGKCSRRGRDGLCQNVCGPGGKGYGSCEDGSTCCLYVLGCNGESRQRISYFQSPSFPLYDTFADSCSLKIKILPGVCAIRLDFDKFSLSPPKRGSYQCKTDSFNILTEEASGLCGVMDGYAVNIPVSSGKLYQKLSVMTKSNKYRWNAKILQIPCNNIAPPPAFRNCGMRRLSGVTESKTEDAEKNSIIVDNESLPRKPYSGQSQDELQLKAAFIRGSDFGMNKFLLGYYSKLANDDETTTLNRQRIFNGIQAKKGEFPWQALLQFGNVVFCGGSLISDRHILTAAHCALLSRDEGMLSKFYVRLGERDYNEYPATLRQTIKVQKVHLYHGYDGEDQHGDVALLELEKPAFLNQGVSPICLPKPGKTYANADGVVSGFGRTKQNQRTSSLYWANVVIWDNQRCNKAWSNDLTSLQVCALGVFGQDTCQGDSGGPLASLSDNGTYELVGLTSFGDVCGVAKLPGVYTRVSSFLDWIAIAMSSI